MASYLRFVCGLRSAVCGLRLPMQGVGNFENQGAVGFSRKNTVGKTGLIVNDKEIVNGAEDVVEAYLECRQVARTVVLKKGRGEEAIGKGDIGTQPKEMGVERSLDQIDIVESVTGAEAHLLVGSNFSTQVERILGTVVKIPNTESSAGGQLPAIK